MYIIGIYSCVNKLKAPKLISEVPLEPLQASRYCTPCRGHKYARNLFVYGEHYSTTQNQAAKPHCASLPKSTQACVDPYTRGGLQGGSALDALCPALDGIKRLGRIHRDSACNRTQSEGCYAVLWHPALLPHLLQHVVGTHADGRRCTLFQRCRRQSFVQRRDSLLLDQYPGGMPAGAVSLCTPGIIDPVFISLFSF